MAINSSLSHLAHSADPLTHGLLEGPKDQSGWPMTGFRHDEPATSNRWERRGGQHDPEPAVLFDVVIITIIRADNPGIQLANL